MSATAFKNVSDNAVSTTATSLAATGVTSITVATGDGAKFPAAPFYVTIWSGVAGSDPASDANMEKVTCTAKSGDVLTITATTKTHSGTVNVANLEVAQQITDIQTAVNNIENGMSNSSLVVNEVPVGSVNGSNTAFTTASNMATGSLRVHRNGIRLKGGGVDFTQGSNNAFTFVTAPNTGDLLLVDYNVSSTGYTVGTNSNITNEAPTGSVNSSNTSFTTARAYIAGSLQVYIDGIMQRRGTDYTETIPSSGTFTMAVAPQTGQNLLVDYQFNLNPSSNADTVDGAHSDELAPVGSIVMYAGSTAPTNYAVCDGSAISRTTYATLFNRIGTAYGSGDGTTTFNLPNLKSNVPVGYNASDTNFNALGKTGGESTHLLTASESGVPAHSHALNSGGGVLGGGAGPAANLTTGGGNYVVSGIANNSATNASSAHNNLQPYLTLNFIIKVA